MQVDEVCFTHQRDASYEVVVDFRVLLGAASEYCYLELSL